MIVNPANDIYRQAQQGSVAAIIQILNEKLADSGVRTRAVLAHGVLQLLCEAATSDQLDKGKLPDRIRKILESIGPRNINHVNINSRLVREQQLLWLEEIHRDPEGQLLWSQEIRLQNPNPLQRLLTETKQGLLRSPRSTALPEREQQQFFRGLLGGLGLGAALLFLGFGLSQLQNQRHQATGNNPAPGNSAQTAQTSPAAQSPSSSAPSPAPESDAFAAAVRLAEKAAEMGKNPPKDPEEIHELADMWGKASELMSTIESSDQRYSIAQDRMAAYRKNKDLFLEEAK